MATPPPNLPAPAVFNLGATMTNVQYTGRVYTAAVGADTANITAINSIINMVRRDGDSFPALMAGTKGFEVRQSAVNRFLSSDYDFMLFLDSDMVFAPDTLELLRSHCLPYVTGAYLRRQVPPAPVWFDYDEADQWPRKPATTVPDKLTRVSASGWGCVLVHRAVFDAVRPLLKGQPEILEDCMAWWPFDHLTVALALQSGDLDTLRQELKPLRLAYDHIGSDIRFPFFARAAGFDLWLDPAVRPAHILDYPLRVDDFEETPRNYRAEYANRITAAVEKARNEAAARLARLG